MWRAGYQVALTDIPVKQQTGKVSYILPGGTSMWGGEARMRNERANKQLIRSCTTTTCPRFKRPCAKPTRRWLLRQTPSAS